MLTFRWVAIPGQKLSRALQNEVDPLAWDLTKGGGGGRCQDDSQIYDVVVVHRTNNALST
jgi:hypothetical protein